MKEPTWRRSWRPVAIMSAMAFVSVAPATQALQPAVGKAMVNVRVDVTGAALPNHTLTAKATVEIMDGSTLKGFSWKQVGGVPATISGANTATAKVRLGPRWQYKSMLLHVLAEPPIEPEDHGEEEEEYSGGLQDRFQVVGASPFALEEAGLVTLEVKVTTTSGAYADEVEIHTGLPWKPSSGLANVPIKTPLILHGKDQGSYDWQLDAPAGSSATLMGATSQDPELTPDVPGLYEVEVTDEARKASVTLYLYAGTWRGVIIGQDGDGRPIADGACTGCHSGEIAPDQFNPWAQTGHAEIFTDNLNTSTHYGPNCFSCHMVGYDPDAANGGSDDARDYQGFLDAGLLNNPGDNWTTMLDEFPATAQLANIQCENCHGPQSALPRQDSEAHGGSFDTIGEPRVSLSSDVCGACHGEPLRHARFQQWQISGHANYELAIDEGDDESCSRCHTANGFLAWVENLTDDDETNDEDEVTVAWEADEIHPQTCAACHDPHDAGTTSGDEPNAKGRISGATPNLLAGFKVMGAGKGALCMTCHNARRGLRNDHTFAKTTDPERAPHAGSQTDVLMGENAYLVNVGVRGPHSLVENTCVNCHMERTDPPADLSYNLGGTNHTFRASEEVCASCHDEVTADALESVVEAVLDDILGLIEDAHAELIEAQLDAGYRIDLDGEATIEDAGDVSAVAFTETHGRQALAITLDGETLGPFSLGDIEVIRPTGRIALAEVADDGLLKAGWNWLLVHADGSHGAHNPRFVLTALDAARDALGGGGLGGPRVVFPWEAAAPTLEK